MKGLLLALVVLGATVPALAAPGDPVALRGVMVWPDALTTEPFVVIRGDDGRFYYADISTAQRTGTPLRAGDRISMLAVESLRPHELAAAAFGAGDSVLAAWPPESGAEVAASPPTGPPPGAPPERPPRAWERIDGTVHAVSGQTLVVRRPDGRKVKVNVAQLGGPASDLRPGHVITLYAVQEPGRTPTAVGLVRSEPDAPGPPR